MAQNGDQSDVVAIPSELSVKHPLQNAWVLWFDNPVKRLGAKDWSSNLKKVLDLYLDPNLATAARSLRQPRIPSFASIL